MYAYMMDRIYYCRHQANLYNTLTRNLLWVCIPFNRRITHKMRNTLNISSCSQCNPSNYPNYKASTQSLSDLNNIHLNKESSIQDDHIWSSSSLNMMHKLDYSSSSPARMCIHPHIHSINSYYCQSKIYMKDGN